jgi:3-hydroxyacyl-[acyl-carrier-protein] dehydratase
MDRQATISIPLTHPCYAGHFPGNPVVPGVVLLDLIVSELSRGPPRVIRSVKFHRAVKPGEGFVLHWKSAGSQVTFRCERDALLLIEGSLTFGAAA